jgi:hypothetical protein
MSIINIFNTFLIGRSGVSSTLMPSTTLLCFVSTVRELPSVASATALHRHFGTIHTVSTTIAADACI